MNHRILINVFLYLHAVSLKAQINDECVPVYINDDDVHPFESASPYDKSLCLKVTTALGYKLEINVQTIDIDGTEPLYDYLLIKPGEDMIDPGPGKIFTHILNTERSYVLFSNKAFIQFNAHVDSDGIINPNNRKGFKFTYQRIGEETITTTTEAPNPNPLPTPDGNDTIYLTAHLSGKRLFEYTQAFVIQLRIAIIEMAKAYCAFAGIPVDPDTTSNTYENVLIQSLMDCPWNWPDRDHCASMQFSLPLYMEPGYKGYQLNRTNMRNMWYHFNSEYLQTIGLRDYEAPDPQKSINIWLILIACVIVAFVVLLGVLRWILGRLVIKGVSILNDRDGDPSVSNERSSYGSAESGFADQDDMQPDPYQTFPQAPAYEDDDEVTYRTYDNYSRPTPEFNRGVLMDSDDYGEAYT